MTSNAERRPIGKSGAQQQQPPTRSSLRTGTAVSIIKCSLNCQEASAISAGWETLCSMVAVCWSDADRLARTFNSADHLELVLNLELAGRLCHRMQAEWEGRRCA